MNLNPEYQNSEEKSNSEMANLALKCLEQNILGKTMDDLEAIDLVGFASIKLFVQELAEKADALEQMAYGKENPFSRN